MTTKAENTICIYHSPCADGFGAAWAVWRSMPNATFHPGVYGEAAPDVEGKHVILVDFSYKADVLRDMAKVAHSVLVLDHHKTAEADLRPLLKDGVVDGRFDMTRSGAVMAWNYFHPRESVPQLLLHVQDRDLWKFELPDTRNISAALFSYPYDFETWTRLASRCEYPEPRAQLSLEGSAIDRAHQKNLRELIPQTKRFMNIGGYVVPVANVPAGVRSRRETPFGILIEKAVTGVVCK